MYLSELILSGCDLALGPLEKHAEFGFTSVKVELFSYIQRDPLECDIYVSYANSVWISDQTPCSVAHDLDSICLG